MAGSVRFFPTLATIAAAYPKSPTSGSAGEAIGQLPRLGPRSKRLGAVIVIRA
jgi:hypothetical protein